jgi:hypothetical protein
VTGTVAAPQELILGRYDRGRLRSPAEPPAHHDGQRPAPRAAPPGHHAPVARAAAAAHLRGGRTAYTRVTPEVVVELSADLAVDGPRWRTRCGSCASAEM